ncbi:MAG: hypothetical protein QM607_12965 [Microbacterium sp.]
MQWVSGVSVGGWITPRLDEEWTIHHFVPHAYEAYARILHPTTRARPTSGEWPQEDDERAWARFGAEIVEEPVTWAQTADAFGAEFAPTSRWGDVTGAWWGAFARDAQGWRYDPPEEGSVDASLLAKIVSALPGDDVFVAVWEGWGDLVGAMTSGIEGMPRRYADDEVPAEHRRLLDRIRLDPFNRPFGKPTWRPGVLSDEISRGPRLSLPDRSHILFRGSLSELQDPEWATHVPWVAQGDEWPHSPSVLWPQDRSWFLSTEVDHDYTVVGGSRAVIDALLGAEGIETQELPEDADLSREPGSTGGE